MTGDWLDRIVTRIKAGSLPEHYRAVFDSDSGRAVLNDLAIRAGLMQTHRGWPPESIQYNAGEQDTVKYIAKMLRMSPADLQSIADREVVDDRNEY